MTSVWRILQGKGPTERELLIAHAKALHQQVPRLDCPACKRFLTKPRQEQPRTYADARGDEQARSEGVIGCQPLRAAQHMKLAKPSNERAGFDSRLGHSDEPERGKEVDHTANTTAPPNVSE